MVETEPLQGAVALGLLEILGQKKAFGDFRMHERFPSLELVSLGLSYGLPDGSSSLDAYFLHSRGCSGFFGLWIYKLEEAAADTPKTTFDGPRFPYISQNFPIQRQNLYLALSLFKDIYIYTYISISIYIYISMYVSPYFVLSVVPFEHPRELQK